MMYTKVAIATLLLFNLSIFAVGMRTVFTTPSGTPREMNWLKILGSIFGLLQIALAWFTPQRHLTLSLLAIGILAASAILFHWTKQTTRPSALSLAFSKDIPVRLIASGPYRLVRHPFYVAYTMTWLGGALGSASYIAYVATLTMFVLYLRAATYEERKFYSSALAGEYERYKSNVGQFVPSIKVVCIKRLPTGNQPNV